MLSVEEVMMSLQDCGIRENPASKHVTRTLGLFLEKLSESSRSSVKRWKERCLEEALQLLRKVPDSELRGLEGDQLQLLVRLLISLQLQMVHISMACRKLDQVSELFPLVLQQESLRDGPLCHITVKVCLQIFQLLSSEVAPAVWDKDSRSPAVQKVLQALMDIILGQSLNRDTRLLAGTAVAMLINTAPESRAGGNAAWSLLQVSHAESWLLTVGGLQVTCSHTGRDGVDRLALSRGLLTCCQPTILLSSHPAATERRLLLEGLFPLVRSLCEEKLDCHCFAFEVLTLWLRKVRECLADVWRVTGVRLLSDNSSLRQKLIDVIWSNAESPVEGVSEFVRSAFRLLLDLYQMDCEHFGVTTKSFYLTLLKRVLKLPWESKAKYHRLCALLPYLGSNMVLDQCAELPDHLLRCLSNNYLSPCGSELYKTLIQQQRRELCSGSPHSAPLTESDLADQWAQRWRPVLLEALTSDVTLLQNNSSTHLLPSTFQVFPSAVEPLLASLDPITPGHLCAWACVMSSYRTTTGASPWALQGSSTLQTLRLALGSADDKIRLAALNLLCCSPKTKDAPSVQELSVMRTFIPQNLNCESSPFRQHFQAGVKRFLVRIRDGCLVQIRGQKGRKEDATFMDHSQEILDQGIGFVDWLSQLPYCYLAPGHCYQRKKTVLLLLSAVLETCTDTWSPDRRKGQPPVNVGSLISQARRRGQWDFFSRTNQLVLISCLEDSTNEIRELSAGLLSRFFPPSFPGDIAAVLLTRAKHLLRSPRVQEAQMGALMMKVLLQNCSFFRSPEQPEECGLNSGRRDTKTSSFISYLVQELQEHYLAAETDMMLAARTAPIHGVLSALQRCLLDVPSRLSDTLGRSLTAEVLDLLDKISLLLLGVLHGRRETAAADMNAPPSFCDMGNAISSLIAQTSGGPQEEEEECVLLSEEHSLVLTCCWVSLKETGIFLGSLVERILSESKSLLAKEDLTRASDIFKSILLKCRHWGAVEGCCVGLTRFCASLLSSSDPELRDIPAHMLKQGLQVLRSPSSTSVTRRAAGLPMLILCVVSAEEASKARPLLSHSVQTLLETARTPLPESWDQTLDLPQVCAVHTLQALVRGSGLGAAVLQFAPAIAILSLTLLSSPCWAMRNAALQLYSSLCSRMLGQRPGSDEGSTKHGMSPAAFFFHYSALQPFLLSELRGAARDLQGSPEEARLHLQPSLYPILTLLAQLQPGVQDSAETLSDFLPPLLQLSASPIYSVRVMASKAVVAMTPPFEYMNILIKLTTQLPSAQERCCHNRLHGQLLQIRAVVDRQVLATDRNLSEDLCEVLSRVEAALWLATEAQRCPLVRAAYLCMVDSLRRFCCVSFLSKLCDTLMSELHAPQEGIQVGLSSFHQQAIQFVCSDQKWACQLWENFSLANPELRLALVTWVAGGRTSQATGLKELIQRPLLVNLREALLSHTAEYRRTYLAALGAAMAGGDSPLPKHSLLSVFLDDSVLFECLDLLLGDLEGQKAGPEFRSQALYAASLLLPQCLQTSVIQRWCCVLESHRSPDAAEVLRIACAESLCVAGVPLMSSSLEEPDRLPPIIIKLINTGLYLLQDQSQPVRMQAACFVSMLQHVRRGNQRSVYLVQVNQALPLLLDLLLEEYWDTPGILEVLLGHLPQPNLTLMLRQASGTGCSSLYEQDDANVFAEPSVMCAYVLPYLMQLADRYSESSELTQSLSAWAKENTAQVLDSLLACKELQSAETLTPAWLSLLLDPSFHSTLCGLLTRAAFLLRLMKTDVQHIPDPAALQTNQQRQQLVQTDAMMQCNIIWRKRQLAARQGNIVCLFNAPLEAFCLDKCPFSNHMRAEDD
ncbi:tRNA (32-2'-O)-methyltransferase regulator THADA [Aulostomus maculatus]